MPQSSITRGGIRYIARELGGSVLQLILLLLAAGTVAWANAWVVTGLTVVYQAFNLLHLWRVNPSLINQRGSLFRDEPARYDRIFVALYLPLSFTIPVIAGLDAVRFGLSTLAPPLELASAVVFVFACGFGAWAMAANPQFETTGTTNTETPHAIATGGPYRLVRHPGYLAELFAIPVYPLMLGSLWGLVPAALLMILFVVRTYYEDRTLQATLPGYRAYATATRYRLLPYIW